MRKAGLPPLLMTMKNDQLPSLSDIHDARRMIAGSALRTPLVRLNTSDAPAEIYLKLENLQPIGSFKIRGATNAMAHIRPRRCLAGYSLRRQETWPRESPGVRVSLAFPAR